jgi:hypothetical protein
VLGLVKVSDLELFLESLQVIHVLLQVVFAEQLEAEALVLLHHRQALRVLECLIERIRLVVLENLDEMIHSIFDRLNLVHVVAGAGDLDALIDAEATPILHHVVSLGWHVPVDLLLAISMVQVQIAHVVVRAADEDVDLNRHQLLHEDEVGEVRDALHVHLLMDLALAARLHILVQLLDLVRILIVDDSEALVVEALLASVKRVDHGLVGLR